MKLLRSVVLLPALFSLSLYAQHGGGGHGGGGGGGFHGGGGGGFGGGAVRGGGGYGYGGYGGFRGGYGGYGYGYRGYGYGYGFGLGFGIGWPYYGYGYGYPYYGGAYYDPYYYGYAPSAYAYAPAAPAVQTYTAPAPAATGSYYRAADYYLIAFNDHSIRAAQSYQVLGDQIEWTPKEGGAVQRAPLSTVDKAFSAQINRDRRVQFTLPQ